MKYMFTMIMSSDEKEKDIRGHYESFFHKVERTTNNKEEIIIKQ